MRKTVLLVFFIMTFLICINGCSAVKKPQELPPSQTKILVPQVSTISFDTIEVKKTPKFVQDVAKDMSGKDATTWLKVNNSVYIVISQSDRTRSYQVEIVEILQKIPAQDFIWAQVTINYEPSAGQENAFINEPLVAKFNLPDDLNLSGVGFNIENVRNIPGNEQITEKRSSPHEVTENPISSLEPASLEITYPTPNEEVTSPFKVTGKFNHINSEKNEQLIVRLRDSANQVIVEKPILTMQSDQDNNFEVLISYPALQKPEKANIEAIWFNQETGAEKNIVKIPIILN